MRIRIWGNIPGDNKGLPVPRSIYASLGAVDGQVADGELLVTNPHAVLATVQNQVAHEATTAVLDVQLHVILSKNRSIHHKVKERYTYTLVRSVALGRHVDNDVIERRGLRDLPMETSGTCGRGLRSEIDMDIANRPIATEK